MPETPPPRPDADTDNQPMTMTRPTLSALPARVVLPPPLVIRPLHGAGEAGEWTRVQRAAEPFFPIEDDLFARAFGTDDAAIAARCFFAIDSASEEIVGTSSGWHGGDESARGDTSPGSGRGADWGRLHWVAVRPNYQRRGIARALVVHCLHQMASLGHTRAYLVTSTGRVGAIALYESLGFVRDDTPLP